MNTREIDAEILGLRTERGWGDWDHDPRTLMLLHLYQAREDARHQILNHVTQLRSSLDSLESGLARPAPILNSLGELQQRPAAVECAVGQFAAASHALTRYLETYPRL